MKKSLFLKQQTKRTKKDNKNNLRALETNMEITQIKKFGIVSWTFDHIQRQYSYTQAIQ